MAIGTDSLPRPNGRATAPRRDPASRPPMSYSGGRGTPRRPSSIAVRITSATAPMVSLHSAEIGVFLLETNFVALAAHFSIWVRALATDLSAFLSLLAVPA